MAVEEYREAIEPDLHHHPFAQQIDDDFQRIDLTTDYKSLPFLFNAVFSCQNQKTNQPKVESILAFFASLL